MDWKKERDALIAQTFAFVQSVTGKTEEAAREAGRPEPRLPSVTPLQPPPVETAYVETAHVEAALEAAFGGSTRVEPAPIEPVTVKPVRVEPVTVEQVTVEQVVIEPVKPSPAPRSIPPLPPSPPLRPIIHSEVKDEILARIEIFRAHQDRFNRERAEYFSATLARMRATIDETRPPRSGPINQAPEPLSLRSSPRPATDRSGTLAGSRSSENGRGPS
jgi:hypothetical protein